MGFVSENIIVNNESVHIWDLGGQSKMRPLWKHYFEGASGIVFVVDSADSSNFQLAKQELHEVAQSSQLRKVPILIYANKQDIEDSATGERIKEVLEANIIGEDRYKVIESSAISGKGLLEGMEWLVNRINHPTK